MLPSLLDDRHEGAAHLGNVYARLIWTLADGFPGIAEADVTELAEVARLLARAVVLADRIADGDAPDTRIHDAMAAHACQVEGLARLARLVPGDHELWDTLRALVDEHARATLREHAPGGPSRDLTAVIDLAIGKNALARACPHALAALGGDDAHLAALDLAVRELCIAVQALDDARDWREDAAAGRPSLVLAQPVRGIAEAIAGAIDLARDRLRAAAVLTAGFPGARWPGLLADLDARLIAARAAVPRAAAS
jgi:hypothetical protein